MGVHRHPEYQCFWPRITSSIHRLIGYPGASLVAERSLTLLLRFVERGGVRRTGGAHRLVQSIAQSLKKVRNIAQWRSLGTLRPSACQPLGERSAEDFFGCDAVAAREQCTFHLRMTMHDTRTAARLPVQADRPCPIHPLAMQLTFDDGPGPSTRALLDALATARCPATFFALGCHLRTDLAVAVRMLHEGHTLGNHTFSHAPAGALSIDALIDEIHRTDRLIRAAYRTADLRPPDSIPLRLPYGVRPGDRRLSALRQLGRSHVGWTGLFEDWLTRPAAQLATSMRRHIVEQRARGEAATLCLHDGSPRGETRDATVQAVRLLLQV